MSDRLLYPVSVMVTRNVEATVGGISKVGGYGTDLAAERVIWKGNNPEPWKAIIHVADPVEVPEEDSDIGFKWWTRTYSIQVYIPDSESDPSIKETYDELIDIVSADIHRAFMLDESRGGFARKTEPRAPTSFIDSSDLTGVIVDVEVWYRHRLDDPNALA